jgi:hypothetical protein
MRKHLLIFYFIYPALLFSQSTKDSTKVLKDSSKTVTVYADETFKGSRVILGQSVENPPNGSLVFLISHHFGAVNTGAYNFFGLDQASTRLGVDYGINNFMAAGVGRSTYDKTFDGYLKFRVLRQSKGKRKMPISMALYGSVAINTVKLSDPNQKDYLDARLSYCTELILARKFGRILSLQIEPVWTHWNLVPTPQDHNDIFSIGGGVSVRVSDVVSLNAEYHYLLPNQHLGGNTNSASVGIDLKVGQHVFQLFLTNSQGNFEESFITQTTEQWLDGFIYFGFNIHRLFTVKTPRRQKG